ncbi:hypothetical protein ACFQE5_01820 [Pseudonocardia hispaniensis]|uniref:Uncharacterized protein n=1 Tax=Pseudonocardia hispaniensis TaxID=904933 RepID=A0ABW1IXB2_9PSEU
MDALADVYQLRDLTGMPWANETAAAQSLASASGMVRAYCEWPIAPTYTETVTLDSDGGQILHLPCLHVTAVTAVTVLGVTLATSDYRWSRAGMLFRAVGWPDGLATVEVTFTGGYDASPAEVVAVVCSLAGRGAAPAGVASMTVGPETVTYARSRDGVGLATSEQAVLDRYRIGQA